MKNEIIKFLYKIFSFLADKTNGWKIFVNPKLFFGALILSVTAISASSCRPTCYDPIPTCYESPSECYVAIDTIPQNDTIPEIMCYDSAEMPENQN